jgi:hypothetical protein
MGDSIQPRGQRSEASKNDGELVNDNAASMSTIENGMSRAEREEAEPLDDQGTTQEEAMQLLQILKEEVFDSNDEKLALALGRPTEDVEALLSGAQTIDSDVFLKARALGIERGGSSYEAE